MTPADFAAFLDHVRAEASAALARLATVDPATLPVNLRAEYEERRREWRQLLAMTEDDVIALHQAACAQAGRELTAEALRRLLGRQSLAYGRRMLIRGGALFVGVAVALLVGCGDNDNSGGTPAPTPTPMRTPLDCNCCAQIGDMCALLECGTPVPAGCIPNAYLQTPTPGGTPAPAFDCIPLTFVPSSEGTPTPCP